MPTLSPLRLRASRVLVAVFWLVLSGSLVTVPTGAHAADQATAFRQAIAEAASSDEAIASFYRDRDYAAFWTGAQDAARRNALLTALSKAGDHALPVSRYDPRSLTQALRTATTERDRGRIEVEMTRAFLDYARDIQTGILVPKKVDKGILREVPVRDRRLQIGAFAEAEPVAFLHGLPPASPEYNRLMKQKLLLERRIADGGWGETINAPALEPGQSGAAVVELRDRLVAMGYLAPTASQDYDAALTAAVKDFQFDHGLAADGVAGAGTITEMNIGPEVRLDSIIVAMERERWMPEDRGARHIWVNLTDFTARIVDHGKTTFETRSVVGKNVADQRTPEFSDEMEYMVINPSWNVPRSITTKEYLPLLKRNRNAAGHLKIVDRAGRVVSRGAIDFSRYTAANFPYSMRQPPSDGNALGLVKFMFPNPYNIYLHDTPSKALFQQEVRAYSHGCIRLGEPFEFAYALLAAQTDDPEDEFGRHLKTGVESAIRLENPVPVHLVYFTAYTSPKGRMNYRKDVYGRDAEILQALMEAGVALPGVRG